MFFERRAFILDMRQLKYFLQVIKDKSITKAAKNLFITQPALSKSLKNMEDELGVELLIKRSSGTEPTDCGVRLAEYVTPLVDSFNHIEDQLQDFLELQKGNVSIGCGPTFGFPYINTIISQFHELYPNIEVTMHVTSARIIKGMLKNYELDIGIFSEPQQDDDSIDLKYPAIHPGEMVVVCNIDHPLAQQRSIRLTDLKNETFNLFSSDFALHTMAINHCRNAGFEPRINFTCNSIELLLDMTASGNGICFLPRPYAEKISACFPTNHILPFDPPIPWVFYLATRQNSYQSYSALTLGNFIQRYFQDNFPEDQETSETTESC